MPIGEKVFGVVVWVAAITEAEGVLDSLYPHRSSVDLRCREGRTCCRPSFTVRVELPLHTTATARRRQLCGAQGKEKDRDPVVSERRKRISDRHSRRGSEKPVR